MPAAIDPGGDDSYNPPSSGSSTPPSFSQQQISSPDSYTPSAPQPTPAPPPVSSGGFPWGSWRDVPTGEQNQLTALADLWEQSIGFQVTLNSDQLLALANAGIQTTREMGQFAQTHWTNAGNALSVMPWATYGLTKDEYASQSNIYSTAYKRITGQDISPQALQQAFQNPRDPTGGLLSSSEYSQQLMNDVNLQKTYGWIKYGLDFNQWTQQKLQARLAFGRDINDAEAATFLQYNRQSAGANMNALARASGQREPGATGVASSLVR